MDHSGAITVGLIVLVLVFLDLLFVELRRVFREGKRIATRLQGYTELPIFSLLAAAGSDADRIAGAVDASSRLLERAQRAIGVLRSYLPKGSSPG